MSDTNLNVPLENTEEVAENFFDCDSTVVKPDIPKPPIERIQEKFITHRQQYRDVNRYHFYFKNILSQSENQSQVEVQSSSFISQVEVQSSSFQSQSDLNNSQITMSQGGSGGSTPQTFSLTDPQLTGLTAQQLAYINQKLNEQVSNVTAATRPIRVTNLTSRIDPPVYNPDAMTSASYFTKCEKYFQAQGCHESQYHNMAHMIMKGNMLLWFDSIVDRINSWADFKKEFKDRFDNANVQAKRNTLLYTRKQKYHESCEQFIQEMVTLAKQINPTEEEHVSVRRAYDGLIPDIRCIAGNLDNLTVNSLLEVLQSTYDTIKSRDRLHGTYTRLPPLHGYTVGSGPQYQSSENRGRGRGGNFFRPRSNSLPQAYTPIQHFQQRNFQPRNNSQVQQSTSTNNTQPGTSSQMNFPAPNPASTFLQHQQTQQTGFRARSNSIPNSNYKQDKGNLRCHKCKQLGHFAKECSNNPGVVMAITGGDDEQYNMQQQQPSTSTGNLNSQWEASQSYDRGSSQY